MLLTLQDELAGKKVRCPQCGGTIQVPLLAEEAPLQAPESAAGALGPPVQEPVETPAPRQTCPQCGATLVGGAASCPQCGASMEAGGVPAARRPRRKKPAAFPVPVVLGVAVLVLVLVAAGVVAALKLMSGKAAAEAEQKPLVQPAQAALRKNGKTPKLEFPVLKAEEERVRGIVAQYLARLAEVAAAREMCRDDAELALRWADLYRFCADNGLRSEAEMCWWKASLLAPREGAANDVLGRTDVFRGQRVTPEQKLFLERLQPRLVIVNRHPEFADLKVGLAGEALHGVPPAESREMAVDPGICTVVLQTTVEGQQGIARLTLLVEDVHRHTVTFIGRYATPLVSVADLPLLAAAVELWGRYQPASNPRAASRLARLGWTRRKNGVWEARAGKKVVTVRPGAEGALDSVRCGVAVLSGRGGATPSVSRSESTIEIVGELSIQQKETSFKLIGTAEEPLVLEAASERSARLRSGIWQSGGRRREFRFVAFEGVEGGYTCEISSARLSSFQDLLGAVSAEVGRSRWRARLTERFKELQTQARDMEARGELLGDWHSALWIEEAMHSARMQEWRRRTWEERARLLRPYAERLDALGVVDRVPYLYVEWPRFRGALASAVGDTWVDAEPGGRPVFLPLMHDADAVAFVEAAVRPPEPEEAAEEQGEDPGVPPLLAPDGFDRDYGTPRRRTARSGRTPERSRNEGALAAVRRLRFICSPAVIECLDGIASHGRDFDLRAEAMLVLGEIGTRQSLAPCRVTVVDETLLAGSLAALAGAGDAEALASLPQKLSSSPSLKTQFLKYLLCVDSPTALLAIERVIDLYKGAPARAQIAARLGEMGGHAAAAQLARLIKPRQTPPMRAVSRIRPEERVLLIRPLGRILYAAGGRGQGKTAGAIASWLAASQPDLALPMLKAAATRTHLPDVALSLASIGSAEALEAVAASGVKIGIEELKSMEERWRSADAPPGEWALRPEVDRAAVSRFLQVLLEEGAQLRVRIAAAELLAKLGERPGSEALLEIAAASVGKPRPALGVPGAGADVAEGREEFRGFMYMMQEAGEARRREEEAAEREVASVAPMRALLLLEEQLAPDLAPGLRKVAERASLPEVKCEVSRLVGLLGDEESREHLLAMASRTAGKYSSPVAMVEEAGKRVAAATGLAAAGDSQFVDVLLDLLVEPPPSPAMFKKPPGDEKYKAALAERQGVVAAGAATALGAVPEDLTLWDIARYEDQAEALVEALGSIAAENTRLAARRADAAQTAADAIRAMGRSERLTDEAWQVLRAIADVEIYGGGAGGEGHGQVQAALLDALSELGGPDGSRLLARLLPVALRHGAKAQWMELCRKLARRGTVYDYQILSMPANVMSRRVVEDVVEIMAAKTGYQSPGYYRFVAHLAALAVDSTGATLTAVGLTETRGRPGRERKRTVKSVKPAVNRWVEDVKLRWRCLQILERGPAGLVGSLLQDPAVGLLDDRLFGPQAGLIVERKQEDFDLAEHLEQWLAKGGSLQKERAVVAVAQAAGERGLLKKFLLTKEVGREQVAGGRLLSEGALQTGSLPDGLFMGLGQELFGESPEEADEEMPEAPERGRQDEGARLSAAGLRYAGRALGALGAQDTLGEALSLERRRGRYRYDYPLPVREAALEGLAYVPPGLDPLQILRGYLQDLPGRSMKRACEEAMLTALGVQAQNTGGPQRERPR